MQSAAENRKRRAEMPSLSCSKPPSSSVLSETRREHRCGSEKENLIGVAGSVLLLQGFGGVFLHNREGEM